MLGTRYLYRHEEQETTESASGDGQELLRESPGRPRCRGTGRHEERGMLWVRGDSAQNENCWPPTSGRRRIRPRL